jgi:hypothetical protein
MPWQDDFIAGTEQDANMGEKINRDLCFLHLLTEA